MLLMSCNVQHTVPGKWLWLQTTLRPSSQQFRIRRRTMSSDLGPAGNGLRPAVPEKRQ